MNIPYDSERPAFTPSEYEICVAGRLGSQTALWFANMSVTLNEQTTPTQTILRGYFVDQAALYGSISCARDLGLTLLSVRRLEETR